MFSGGGLRCFWQGGFMDVVRDEIGLAPARIASVSGGALSAAGFLCRRGPLVYQVMTKRFAEQDHNIAWHSFEEDGLTPHQRLYRECVDAVIDADARREIADGPPWDVLLGHPPADGMPTASGTVAALAYEAELHTRNSPHARAPSALGVTATRVDGRAAARDGRLTDLICAAAIIPPVFEPMVWDGRPVVDGGLYDQAPMPEPDRGRTLVVLTRRYERLPDVTGREYVWPSEEAPIDKIDFTDAQKLRRTWAQGEADGATYLEARRSARGPV